jgi:uncharacterized protein (DUF58 family)
MRQKLARGSKSDEVLKGVCALATAASRRGDDIRLVEGAETPSRDAEQSGHFALRKDIRHRFAPPCRLRAGRF